MKGKRIVSVLAAFALVAGLSLLGTAHAEDQVQTIQVVGQGIIFNGDKATARDKAIEDAQRKAVEQVVGTFVSASTLVQNFQVIDDQILTKSKGFVKSYKVLDEKVDGNVYIVRIEAQVLLSDVKNSIDAIQNMLAMKEYPRVMLLIAEQNIGQSGFSYWWGATSGSTDLGVVENTIINEWGSKGFRFVDHRVLAGKIKKRKAYQVTSAQGLSTQQAEEIANLSDAQIVLTGTAIAKDVGTIMGTQMHSGQANISVRVINTDNGEILATATVHAAAAHIDPVTAGTKALQKAAKKLCDELLEKVLNKWATSANMIKLEVEGIKDYKTLNTFKSTMLNEVRGVKGIYERNYKSGAVAEFDLRYQGKISNLATELEAKDFEAFKVKVLKNSANTIRIKLIPKKK